MAYKAVPLFAPLTADCRPRRRHRRPRAPPAGGTPRARRRQRCGRVPGARGGGGGRGRGPQVPLDRQERYDNQVFPRGGGPGSLAGRGGGAGCGRR